MCASSLCCGSVYNYGVDPTSLNAKYSKNFVSSNNGVITFNSQEAVNAYNAAYFDSTKYCMPSTPGFTTSSYYNTTSSLGIVTVGTTNNIYVYACNPLFVLGQSAQMIQAAAVTLLAAATMLYIA